jgi:crotonobetainyl-CoA:carnitine CoA-transferase CaiB-like acyl-CoA transferase
MLSHYPRHLERMQPQAEARGNRELQRELREIFRGRSAREWIRLGEEKNFPIAPVNTPKTIADDPQFRERLPWYPRERVLVR